MSVPDAVIFRPALDSGQLTYGAVRKLQEEEQLRALQRRLGKFFISQVAELASRSFAVWRGFVVFSEIFGVGYRGSLGVWHSGALCADPLRRRESIGDEKMAGCS